MTEIAGEGKVNRSAGSPRNHCNQSIREKMEPVLNKCQVSRLGRDPTVGFRAV